MGRKTNTAKYGGRGLAGSQCQRPARVRAKIEAPPCESVRADQLFGGRCPERGVARTAGPASSARAQPGGGAVLECRPTTMLHTVSFFFFLPVTGHAMCSFHPRSARICIRQMDHRFQGFPEFSCSISIGGNISDCELRLDRPRLAHEVIRTALTTPLAYILLPPLAAEPGLRFSCYHDSVLLGASQHLCSTAIVLTLSACF